jgi:hypothetical protein
MEFLLPFEVQGPRLHATQPGAEEYRRWVNDFRARQHDTFKLNEGLGDSILFAFFLGEEAIEVVNSVATESSAPVLWIRSIQLAVSALHVGLAGCLSEAAAIARSAIEFAAMANFIFEDPSREAAFLNYERGSPEWRNAFEKANASKQWEKVPPLQTLKTHFHEYGAHGTKTALGLHVQVLKDGFSLSPFASHLEQPMVLASLLSTCEEIAIVIRYRLGLEEEHELSRRIDTFGEYLSVYRRFMRNAGAQVD